MVSLSMRGSDREGSWKEAAHEKLESCPEPADVGAKSVRKSSSHVQPLQNSQGTAQQAAKTDVQQATSRSRAAAPAQAQAQAAHAGWRHSSHSSSALDLQASQAAAAAAAAAAASHRTHLLHASTSAPLQPQGHTSTLLSSHTLPSTESHSSFQSSASATLLGSESMGGFIPSAAHCATLPTPASVNLPTPSGAAYLAESVFDGVKMKLKRLQDEVRDRDASVEALHRVRVWKHLIG
jgi:hypothetical protein